jgi:octaprenyl-diphosphate synthase
VGEDFWAFISEDLKRVELEAKENLKSPVWLVTKIGEHILLGGGKRIRPALLILSSKLCGYEGEAHIPLAVAIEFIHTATLLHDDVVDNAELRRGVPAAHLLWGNAASVLVGDFLLSRAFSLMVRFGNKRVLEVMAKATTDLAEGETFEIMKTGDVSFSEEENMFLITKKTASLIAASTRIGAILAEAPLWEEEALYNYGLNLGIAFQLVDDCLDYVGKEEVLGKKVGSDLREGKLTLPLIFALRQSSEEERRTIEEVLGGKREEEGLIEVIIGIVNKYGGIEYTRQLAQKYVNQAKQSLFCFPSSPEREALFKLADYVLERNF